MKYVKLTKLLFKISCCYKDMKKKLNKFIIIIKTKVLLLSGLYIGEVIILFGRYVLIIIYTWGVELVYLRAVPLSVIWLLMVLAE